MATVDNIEIETHVSPSNKKPWYRTASAYWLLPMFIVIAITGGLTVATGVQLYLKAVCHDYYSKRNLPFTFTLKPISPDNECNSPNVQSVTSKFLMATSLCTAIPAIFVLGPLGTLSDRKGRRRTLLISSGGTILSTLVLIVVGNFLETFGMYCFLIGPLIDGITGGFYALTEASYAYATDCTHPTRRSVVFGWIQGAMFAGFAIGPTIGGWLVKITDNLLSVNYVILVIYVMLFLFYIFILPESLSKERLASNLKRQQEIRSRQKSWINMAIYRIFGALLVFLPQKQQNDDDKIPISFATKYSSLFLAISYTLLSASIMAFTGIFVLYTALEFKWNLIQQGYFVLMMSLSKVFVLYVLYPAIVKFKKPILALISNVKKRIMKDNDDDEEKMVVKLDNDSKNDKNKNENVNENEKNKNENVNENEKNKNENVNENEKNKNENVNENEKNKNENVNENEKNKNENVNENEKNKNENVNENDKNKNENVENDKNKNENANGNEKNENTDGKIDEIQMRKELTFEVWVIRLVFLIDALAHLAYGLSTSSSVFIGATVISAIGIITTPAVKSLQTNLIPPSQIGRLLGAISVIDSILRIFVPLIFDGLYSVFVKTSPNLIWYFVAILLVLAFLFAFGVRSKNRY